MSSAAEEAEELVELGRSVVKRARAQGADVAEASVHSGSHLSVKVRMHEPELVEEAGSRALGLRVMVGKRVASTYTSDLSEAGRRLLIEDALELAKLSEVDEFAGPPDPSELSSASEWADLDTFDETVGRISADEALQRALAGERAAFDYDDRITNSEGASFTRARGASALVTSGGFAGSGARPSEKKRRVELWLNSAPRSCRHRSCRSSSTKTQLVRFSDCWRAACSGAPSGGRAPTWWTASARAWRAISSPSSTIRYSCAALARVPSTEKV